MNYQISKYTYIVALDGEQTVLFNGYSRQFVIIPSFKLKMYLSIIKNANNVCKEKNTIFLQIRHSLLQSNILIDSTIDEHKLVLDMMESYRNKNEFHTMIIPTYQCNYRCWYCVQVHHKTDISPNVVNLIKRHIIKYLANNKVPRYVLYWFGGEPLLQKDVICDVTNEIREYCYNNGIQFVGQITTNGALLDIPTINMLKLAKINSYQITLDGDKKLHDKTKYDGVHCSSFDLIVGNIANLLQINRNAMVLLRFNYTPQNVKHLSVVEELDKLIPLKFRDRIQIDLQRVWQTNEEEIPIDSLKSLQEKFVDSHFRLSTLDMFEPCYVEKHRFEVIYYNGKVDICDNFAFDKARGCITEDGNVDWGQALAIPKMHEECIRCTYYPVCLGECPAKRLNRYVKGETFKCQEFMKKHVEYIIKDYCLRSINNKKLI